MHPQQKGAHLDAIYFSGHKFLGGPGAPGILVFNSRLYTNHVPDQPGGGTVLYSNPWESHCYVNSIEQREDGGTPPFLGAIKAAMCVRLKELMGIGKIRKREREMVELVFRRLQTIKNLVLLEAGNKQRLAIFSFVVKDTSHHLFVKLLNDRFGIQSRGGCSCAGTYGHYLLSVGKEKSYEILHALRKGDLSVKPGWIRISLHPVMSNATISALMDAVELTAASYPAWSMDYSYDPDSNEYYHKGMSSNKQTQADTWFTPFIPEEATHKR
jgi:selenocysteine lyase/cysteine desulfurase